VKKIVFAAPGFENRESKLKEGDSVDTQMAPSEKKEN